MKRTLITQCFGFGEETSVHHACHSEQEQLNFFYYIESTSLPTAHRQLIVQYFY